MKQARYLLVLAGVLLLPTACKDDQACEATRLELARLWSVAKETAAKRKLVHDSVAETMNEAQRETHVSAWTKMENKSDLLASSYQTTQVTWDSARQARSDLQLELASYEQKQLPTTAQGFDRIVKEAAVKSEAFEKQCR